jgi:hypothetical protein
LNAESPFDFVVSVERSAERVNAHSFVCVISDFAVRHESSVEFDAEGLRLVPEDGTKGRSQFGNSAFDETESNPNSKVRGGRLGWGLRR